MKNKICILSSVHPSFDTRIFHKEARTLVEAGYEVVFIVQHDKAETVNGVRIVPLPKPRDRFSRMFGLTWKVLLLGLKENASAYHFHDPELMPMGVLLKCLGKRVVYDVHEDVPGQIVGKHWIPWPIRRIVSFVALCLEGFFAIFFDGIVVVTPRIGRKFPAGKTVCVQNFPMISDLVTGEPFQYRDRKPWVVYIGGLSRIRCVEEMLKAIDLLPESLKVCFKIAGNFSPPSLEGSLSKMPGWRRADWLGWVSRGDADQLALAARVGLVLFYPLPNHMDAQSNKLFEYMSAGVPSVSSDFPLWRKIIEDVRCGICVDPLNPKAIAAAIQWLLEHPREAEEMGRNGQRAVREKYNWDHEAKKLLNFYEKLFT